MRVRFKPGIVKKYVNIQFPSDWEKCNVCGYYIKDEKMFFIQSSYSFYVCTICAPAEEIAYAAFKKKHSGYQPKVVERTLLSKFPVNDIYYIQLDPEGLRFRYNFHPCSWYDSGPGGPWVKATFKETVDEHLFAMHYINSKGTKQEFNIPIKGSYAYFDSLPNLQGWPRLSKV